MTDVFFFDSSALAKRYFLEVGTNYVNGLVTKHQAVHFIARLTLVELSSAVVRRAPPATLPNLLTHLDNDAVSVYTSVAIDDALIDAAIRLVRVYRLRGGDALQLASALRIAGRIPGLLFISADDELNAAATVEGFGVENPNWYP